MVKADSGILTKKEYSKLASDIRELIILGKKKAVELARNQLAHTYWLIGKRISAERLTQKANYKALIFDDLSKEIGIDKTVLARCIYFFNSYPDGIAESHLSWSHYKELIGVKEDDLRLELERQAIENDWSRNRLAEAIKKERERGRKAKLFIKGKKSLVRPKEVSYVYKAVVENVIDGDSLLLRIDLGFQVHKVQRIRLSGIDSEAMNSDKGRASFEYIRDRMALVNFIMVKTSKIDVYGRYLGHVFYDIGDSILAKKNKTKEDRIFEEGNYLNQELVNLGFAKVI